MFKSEKAEVCYKIHEAGEFIQPHYHKVATEINVLLEGEMEVNGEKILPNDIFLLEPNEIVYATPIKTSKLIVVKIPSIVGDKYEV
jgi:mannose-6-phosphate isomerase-like protein (cupin superfamily)